MFAIPTDIPTAIRIPSGDQPTFLYCGFAISFILKRPIFKDTNDSTTYLVLNGQTFVCCILSTILFFLHNIYNNV